MHKIKLDVIREDRDIRADPRACADVDLRAVVDARVLADEDVVVDLDVVAVGASEAGLDLDAGPETALVAFQGCDETVRVVFGGQEDLGEHVLQFGFGDAGAELTGVVVAEEGVGAALALVLQRRVEVVVGGASEHFRALDIFHCEGAGGAFGLVGGVRGCCYCGVGCVCGCDCSGGGVGGVEAMSGGWELGGCVYARWVGWAGRVFLLLRWLLRWRVVS